MAKIRIKNKAQLKRAIERIFEPAGTEAAPDPFGEAASKLLIELFERLIEMEDRVAALDGLSVE